MLSIGKIGLARSQQLYYERQVARGAEDYYAGRGEMPGRWAGSGARLLGLEGELGADQLTSLMDGMDPATGAELRRRTGRCSTAALDLTFSAPKSVSVLFAVGDHRLSQALVDAHEEAVDAALGYLEREACRVRRGHNGTREEREAGDPRGWERARSEPAGGFVAAAYRHRMSRAQDPQLHTHVVCANMARGGDGRWTALDGRPIYEHAKAAGCLYEAHLRHAVRQRVPWASWSTVRDGIAELDQVPMAVREEFSQRRQRILERARELEAAGVAVGRNGRERIVFDTREPKRQVAEADWRAEVRARAAEHGLGSEELERLTTLPPRPRGGAVAEAGLARHLYSPDGLTATQNTFADRDVIIAAAEAQRDGTPAEELRALAERLVDRPEVVRLSTGLGHRYTTRELLGAEETIVRHGAAGRGRGTAMIDRRQINAALDALACPLTDGQAAVVAGIATSGNRVDIVEALAGTGKTTCAAALREVYERAGYQVLGAAPTARATRELAERAGVKDARTLDGWAMKLAADPDALLEEAHTDDRRPPPVVLIIDEAGMANTRISAQVIERAMTVRAKVIAIGDSGQLSSIQAGGWLGALTRRLGSFELREVMRQRDPAERRALGKLHRGEPESYLRLKRARGCLDVFSGEQAGAEAERRLVARWAATALEFGGAQAVMICRDNHRRERLNDLARGSLRGHGRLGEDVEIAGRAWALGDRVIARRNDRARDLDNGMRGTITALDEHLGATVRLDSGATRQLDPEYLAGHVEHAYALTGHAVQGGTVEWAGVIGRPHDFSRNWSYTALSRAREPVELFVVDEPSAAERQREPIAPAAPASHVGTLDRLSRRMRERDDEDLALEQLERAGSPEDFGSSARERIYQLERQLEEIHVQRKALPIEDAHWIDRIANTIAAIEQEHARDRRPRGWRDRSGHQTRRRERERHLERLREEDGKLLERVPDPRGVLECADQLHAQQQALARERHGLREQAITDELARRPPWLEASVGPEPTELRLRERWQRTAREIAGQRIDRHITDPHTAMDPQAPDRLLARSISDTRLALGLNAGRQARDAGIGF